MPGGASRTPWPKYRPAFGFVDSPSSITEVTKTRSPQTTGHDQASPGTSIDQKTFRPIALGVPCLFWLIELAERHRYRSAFLCLLLALSAKEDVALISFPLLAVLAFRAGKPA